ncbi:MAG: hypothetical protein O3A01_03335 [bacterium]|nr:hypothetical protein [bacterium]
MATEEIEFYDVKKREKVKVKLKDIKKTKYERKLKSGQTQTRYAFRAQSDGRSLTKFCSEADWNKVDVAQV